MAPIGLAGWKFSDAVTIGAGATQVPGTLEWINGSPWTVGVDRSLANTFFRPGASRGAFAAGELADRTLHYQAGIWHAIDGGTAGVLRRGTSMAFAGNTWWEPWAPFGLGMGDMEHHDTPAEYSFRLLDEFRGTGPFERTSLFDQGSMGSVSWCFVPRTYEVYARSSVVTGPFGTGQEYGGGLNAYIHRSRQA